MLLITPDSRLGRIVMKSKTEKMTPCDVIKYLCEHGFNVQGTEYRKDILVVKRNDEEKRFEVYYNTGDLTPAYLYDDFIKDSTPAVIDSFFSGLYNAISTFNMPD